MDNENDYKKLIEEALSSKRFNLDGEEYDLFACNEVNREESIARMSECLNKMRIAIVELTSEKNKEKMNEHFMEVFKEISAIRIDETDRDSYPMKIMFDEFTQNGQIPFSEKKKDGVTSSDKRDGIMLLYPEMADDVKDKREGYSPAIHTLVHEFTHLLSIHLERQDNGEESYVQGLQYSGHDNLLDDFNEGLTEALSEQLLRKMYPEARIEDRYATRKDLANGFMESLDSEVKQETFEAYVGGNADQIYNKLFEQLKHKETFREKILSMIKNKETPKNFKDKLGQEMDAGTRVCSGDEETIQTVKRLVDDFKGFKRGLPENVNGNQIAIEDAKDEEQIRE